MAMVSTWQGFAVRRHEGVPARHNWDHAPWHSCPGIRCTSQVHVHWAHEPYRNQGKPWINNNKNSFVAFFLLENRLSLLVRTKYCKTERESCIVKQSNRNALFSLLQKCWLLTVWLGLYHCSKSCFWDLALWRLPRKYHHLVCQACSFCVSLIQRRMRVKFFVLIP